MRYFSLVLLTSCFGSKDQLDSYPGDLVFVGLPWQLHTFDSWVNREMCDECTQCMGFSPTGVVVFWDAEGGLRDHGIYEEVYTTPSEAEFFLPEKSDTWTAYAWKSSGASPGLRRVTMTIGDFEVRPPIDALCEGFPEEYR